MTDKGFVELDKNDLISLILGVDEELDFKTVETLPENIKNCGFWNGYADNIYWIWNRYKLLDSSFEELVELYKIVKTLK